MHPKQISSSSRKQFPGTEKPGILRFFRDSAHRNSGIDRVLLLNKPGTRMDGNGLWRPECDPGESISVDGLNDLIPSAFLPLCRRLIQEAFLSGCQKAFEYQLTEFDQVHDYEARMIPDGADRLFVVISNTTRQKWAELWLSESEAHFRSIFENSPNAIGVSTDGIHVFVNPEYVRMFGYERDTELLGRPILSLVVSAHRRLFKHVLQRRFTGDRNLASFDVLAIGKDKTRFPVHVSSSVYQRLDRIYSIAHVHRNTAATGESTSHWDSCSVESLSTRQREVLRLIAEGQSTKQVAATLGISFKTADTHRSNLMQKLNAHETATLVRLAVHFGLVAP